MTEAASDIDSVDISEQLDEYNPDQVEEIRDLIEKATVTVSWPQHEAGEPVTEPDLVAWCRDRAANHRTYEHHESPIYQDRDVALVEWTVRTLGNPLILTSARALAVIAQRHGLQLVPAEPAGDAQVRAAADALVRATDPLVSGVDDLDDDGQRFALATTRAVLAAARGESTSGDDRATPA
ncbi:hypothetical protein GCM10027605_68990 [Micromonospora zhanjiangensis]